MRRQPVWGIPPGPKQGMPGWQIPPGGAVLSAWGLSL